MWKNIISKNNQNNNKDFINYQYNLIKVLNVRESSKNKNSLNLKRKYHMKVYCLICARKNSKDCQIKI